MTLYHTDKEGILKDMNSKAVINTDLAAFQRYKAQRAKNQESSYLKTEVKRLSSENELIRAELNDLHNAMAELKALILGQ